MSRILRRPMFRGGGPVDSYGTGIAAPLVPGYQGGGQIGGGEIYGIPMADGRYGFKKPVRFDTSGITGVNTKGGMDLLNQNKALNTVAPVPNTNMIPGVVEDEGELTASEILANKQAFEEKIGTNTWDKTITIPERTIRGVVQPSRTIDNPNYVPPSKTIDRTVRGSTSKVKVPLSEEELKKLTTTTKPGEETIYSDEISKEVKTPGDDNTTIEDTEETLAIDPKDAIAANQKLFAELLGADKARGQDIGDMLLRFSGSGGNTIGEKFQNYVRAESAAGPSRSEKIKQTAAGLAINDYVAGKRSDEQIEKLKEVETWRSNLKQNQYTVNPETDSWREALDKTVLKYGGKEGKSGDVPIIAETIKFYEPGLTVYREDGASDKPKKLKKLYEDLEIGITIITFKNGSKKIIKKTSEDSFDDITSKYPV